jgi:hypothetical protein
MRSIEQTAALIPIPRITSFFKPVSTDVLDIPYGSYAEIADVTNEPVESSLSTPPIVTSENIGKMIEYLIRHDDNKGFTSLIQHKAITEYYILNGENEKNTESFLATLSIASGFKEAPEEREDQWRSHIKYYVANSEDTKHIELKDFLSYFLENGRMKNEDERSR